MHRLIKIGDTYVRESSISAISTNYPGLGDGLCVTLTSGKECAVFYDSEEEAQHAFEILIKLWEDSCEGK